MRNYGQNINLNLVTYFGRFFHRSINRVNSVSRRNYVPFSRSEPLSDSDSVTKIVIYRFWLWSQGTVRFLSLKSTERLTILIQALLVACVARVSVWFRGDRARNEMRTKKWKREEGEGKKASLFLSSPLPPRSFACAIFRAVFDSRSSFFAPKPHRNACYACYLVGSPGGRVGMYSQ